jgi:hypothetical protein
MIKKTIKPISNIFVHNDNRNYLALTAMVITPTFLMLNIVITLKLFKLV